VPQGRPAIPVEIRREVLLEARHHCAVCCGGLALEFAHIVPWSKSADHSVENLVALCANCHTRADNEKWGVSSLKHYKDRPCIVTRGAMPPISPAQQAVVDLIVAYNPDQMTDKERHRLVGIVAAYAGVSLQHVSVVSVTQANSSLVRLLVPRSAAKRLERGFKERDSRFRAFFDELRVLDAAAHDDVGHAPVVEFPMSFRVPGKG